MTRSLSDAPTADELAAVGCLFERVDRVNAVADRCNTLPPTLSVVRREALAVLKRTHSKGQLAIRFGRTRGWVDHVLRHNRQEAS